MRSRERAGREDVVMTPPLPELVDDGRVQLRRRRLADIPELRAAIAASVPELQAFLPWAADGVPSVEALRAEVSAGDAAFEAGSAFEYLIRESSSGDLVGRAGAWLRDDDPAVLELGYWVRTDRTGRGSATRAARALANAAFDAMPTIARIEIRMDKANIRSRGVAERLGFTLIGEEAFDGPLLPGQTGQRWIWSMTRDDWLGRS